MRLLMKISSFFFSFLVMVKRGVVIDRQYTFDNMH
ncbi:MAG: hypothetical protein K0R93_978 [Anaerosolibacter sp.]|jgi:hypothetical protein|nr:hypothetical protein [Anaerosolibacter sp.]